MQNLINNFNNSVTELIESISQYNVEISPREIFEAVKYSDKLTINQLDELVVNKIITRLNYKISQYAMYSTSYRVGWNDINSNLSLDEKILLLNNKYFELLEKQKQQAIDYAAEDFKNKTLTLSSTCEWLYDFSLQKDRYDISHRLEPQFLNLLINHFFGIKNAYPTNTNEWYELRKTELKHDLLNVKCYKNGNVKISKKGN